VRALLYEGRRVDFAFEKPVGGSADRRHHIRLWKVLEHGDEGRPVWLGAATFDRGVGLSRYTGAVTHHIAPDVDAERTLITADLQAAGMVEARYQVTGTGPTLLGRNGEGDPYRTDGEVWVLRLVEGCARRTVPPLVLDAPAVVQAKDAVWKSIAGFYRDAGR